MGRKCSVHGLAAGPDGKCVLCRRPGDTSILPRAPARVPDWLLPAIVIGVGALAGVGVAVYVAQNALESRAEQGELAASVATTEPAVEGLRAPAPEEPARPAVDPAPPPRVWKQLGTPGQPTPAAEASQPPEPTPEQTVRPPTQAPAVPTPREVRSALSRVPITVYTTAWCPRCTEARRWFLHNQIPFVEHDIEKDPAQKQAMRALNPGGGVPTIDIDGEVVVGWSEQRVSNLLANSVKHRLGR